MFMQFALKTWKFLNDDRIFILDSVKKKTSESDWVKEKHDLSENIILEHYNTDQQKGSRMLCLRFSLRLGLEGCLGRQ